MTYAIIWHEEIYNDLKVIDINEAKKIITKVNDYLIEDPIALGKPLASEFKGLLRYRYGDYRIIYTVKENDKEIKVLYVGHRKDI